MAAADYTFDEDTTADIKKLAQPYSEVHKAEPAVYREAVQLVALDVVNQLGPSPATVISSIMPRLQQMFMELFPREHVRGELTKLIGKGGSLNTAIAEYRRGGKKARQPAESYHGNGATTIADEEDDCSQKGYPLISSHCCTRT